MLRGGEDFLTWKSFLVSSFVGFLVSLFVDFLVSKFLLGFEVFKVSKIHIMFLIDIDPISPKFHFMFLIDIDPKSKIFKNLSDGSSEFVGPHLFPQKW